MKAQNSAPKLHQSVTLKERDLHMTSLVDQLWSMHFFSTAYICTACLSLLQRWGEELLICFILAVTFWVWQSLQEREWSHPLSKSSGHSQFGEGAWEGTEMTAMPRGAWHDSQEEWGAPWSQLWWQQRDGGLPEHMEGVSWRLLHSRLSNKTRGRACPLGTPKKSLLF